MTARWRGSAVLTISTASSRSWSGRSREDPTWAWAFPDPALRAEQQRRMFRLYVEGAARYPSVWLNADATAAAVWIPPGGTEMSDEQAAMVEPLLVELLGDDARRVLALVQAFEDAHPHHADHYYLTLLGTDPAHRGNGLGLRLLEDTLQLADDDGTPAHLEASNPANIPLYERSDSRRTRRSQFPTAPTLTTMWRDPR